MTYTWAEIQILSLQKMFLNNTPITVDDLENLKTNKKYQLYLNAMPAIANEGLLRLMTVGKPLIKKYTLSYDTPIEIFDYQSYETYTVLNDDLIISGMKSKSFLIAMQMQRGTFSSARNWTRRWMCRLYPSRKNRRSAK